MSWTLHNADCIAAMQAMPDKAYDLAIVDPPYGIGADKGCAHSSIRDNSKWANADWDSSIPSKEYFDQLFRVSINQIIWGGNYFLDYLPSTQCLVIWNKPERNFSLADAEVAWTSFSRAVRCFDHPRLEGAGPRFHPTQKPVALYKWLLKNYAKPNDRILDTHGGSCSSVIAAIDMGFSIDAYELDPDYYAQALKRIQTHELQPRLIPTEQEPQPMQAVLL